jgi:hypothetical protein
LGRKVLAEVASVARQDTILAWYRKLVARDGSKVRSNLAANKIGRQLRQSIKLILGPAVDDRYVLALDITSLFQALAKCSQPFRDRIGRSGV